MVQTSHAVELPQMVDWKLVVLSSTILSLASYRAAPPP